MDGLWMLMRKSLLVFLKECFNSPYGTKYFPEYAEPLNGPTAKKLAEAAKENSVYLVGGSFPEKEGTKYFNTSLVFDPNGELLATHRKVHLFDIDVPGKIRFQESEILSPGNQVTTFNTSTGNALSPSLSLFSSLFNPIWAVEFGQVGLAICYDIRFAELSMIMARRGCKLLVFPGAFNMTTGPAHWELLQRARAVDNQVFVAACSPARDETATYVAWGHSTVVNPWGQVIATTEEKEGIVYASIDFDEVASFRDSLPITKQRREDLYGVEDKTESK